MFSKKKKKNQPVMKILCQVGMSFPLYGPFGEVKSYIAKVTCVCIVIIL